MIIMKKIFFVLGIAFCAGFTTNAQTVSCPESMVGSTELLPSYPGGIKALQTFVSKDLATAQLGERKTGKVTVYFMIDEAGKAFDFQVLNGFDEKYDALALQTVKKIQRWVPGKFGDTPRVMGHKVEISF